LSLAINQAQSGCSSIPFINASALALPFKDEAFDGVYCYGLLHEFVGPDAPAQVEKVMREIERLLQPGGILILTLVSGEPDQGLPHLTLSNESMFDAAVARFEWLEKRHYNDTSCTGVSGYHVWYGRVIKKG